MVVRGQQREAEMLLVERMLGRQCLKLLSSLLTEIEPFGCCYFAEPEVVCN